MRSGSGAEAGLGCGYLLQSEISELEEPETALLPTTTSTRVSHKQRVFFGDAAGEPQAARLLTNT